MIAGQSEAPPAAVASAPRIRTRFLIALGLTNIVLIAWATAQVFAALSTAPVPTNGVEPASVASIAIAAPESLRAPPDRPGGAGDARLGLVVGCDGSAGPRREPPSPLSVTLARATRGNGPPSRR